MSAFVQQGLLDLPHLCGGNVLEPDLALVAEERLPGPPVSDLKQHDAQAVEVEGCDKSLAHKSLGMWMAINVLRWRLRRLFAQLIGRILSRKLVSGQIRLVQRTQGVAGFFEKKHIL